MNKSLLETLSISSRLIIEEAEKIWFKSKILLKERNLFLLKNEKEEKYFKNIDCGLNNSFAYKIAKEKDLTYIMLKKYKINTPESIYISENDLENIDYKKLTPPLVLKPINWIHGTWVIMNLKTKREIMKSVKLSFKTLKTSKLILQEQISWNDYRILIVWDEVVAWAKRIPPYIIWDWEKSILDLINIENKNPFRWKWKSHDSSMSKIKIDEDTNITLKKQWYKINSILEKDKKIFVRSNCNLSTGGSAIDVTDIINDNIKKQCLKLCKACQLKIAWIDILTTDISKTLKETWGAIIELNSTPWLRMHHFPSKWESRNVAQSIVKLIFNV